MGRDLTRPQQRRYCARLARGERIAPSRERFEPYAYSRLASQSRLSRNTLDTYRLQLRVHLIPAFGQLRLTSIDANRVASFIARKSMTHKPSSVRSMLAPLSLVLNAAVRDGITGQNPIKKLERRERPRSERREHRILEPDEIAGLLAAAPERYVLLLKTAIYTGLRQAELLALQWHDVDFDGGVIRSAGSSTARRWRGRRSLRRTPACAT